MTTNTELIARLRVIAGKGLADYFNSGHPNSNAITEAADAIEALEASQERNTKYTLALQDDALKLQTELEKQFADAAKQQPSVPEGWKQAVALAYGHLWHVNNEPMAPIPLRSSETAAYEARKQLRDLLTREERGLAINQVQAMLAAAPQPKETK